MISEVLAGRRDWCIARGDVRERLSDFPDHSVHVMCTSPPYYGLRDYGVEGQIGLEPSVDHFVDVMVQVMRDVRRVLRPDGTAWVNLGDTYNSTPPGNTRSNGGIQQSRKAYGPDGRGGRYRGLDHTGGLKPKDLMMVPARVAIALQQDGWYLRSEIVWCKRSVVPQSATDRPTQATERVYLLAPSRKYFYDPDAVRVKTGREATPEQYAKAKERSWPSGMEDGMYAAQHKHKHVPALTHPSGRNLWDYWVLSSGGRDKSGHYATFPLEIPRRAILAGTSERGVCADCGAPWRRVTIKRGGTTGRAWHDHEADMVVGQRKANKERDEPYEVVTLGWRPTCKHDAPVVGAVVLDPFSGTGTTVLQALRLGRRGIGIELNPKYAARSELRIWRDAPLLNSFGVDLARMSVQEAGG